jgi:hypothetical protein
MYLVAVAGDSKRLMWPLGPTARQYAGYTFQSGLSDNGGVGKVCFGPPRHRKIPERGKYDIALKCFVHPKQQYVQQAQLGTLFKLISRALSSPTSCGRSAGIVRLPTQATELSFSFLGAYWYAWITIIIIIITTIAVALVHSENYARS